MKKIVAAAAAALLLAGAAFADVSFSWTGTRIVGGTSKALNSVTNSNDCIGLKFSNDIAGVVFDWDINSKKTTVAKGGTKDVTVQPTLGLDQYYGWMTFGLPVGNLQVTSGKWTARYVDRVNSDGGDLDSDYYEAYKPGAIAGIVNDFVGLAADSDNLTGVTDGEEISQKMSTILAYTLADTLPGTLMVKGGFVNMISIRGGKTYIAIPNGTVETASDYDKEVSELGYGKFDSMSGFVAEVAYRQENVINLNFAWKSITDGANSIGVFVSPLMVEKLQATAGFSFGSYSEDLTGGDSSSEMGIDLRARYQLSDVTAVTGMFNYSTLGKEIAGTADDLAAMWTMLSVSRVCGDNIRFLATLQNTVRDFDASYGKNLTRFTPACEIKASEKATITAAWDIVWDNKRPYAGVGDVSLPVYVSFSL